MTERLPAVDNPRSDRVRTLVSLGRRSSRSKKQLLRVEGPQAVAELLAWKPETVKDVYFTGAALQQHVNLWTAAQEVTRWCRIMTPQIAKEVADEAQGIIATCTPDAVLSEGLPRPAPVWVLMPETRDPGNAGTIIRNADALGAAGVIATKGTVDLASPKVIRSSAGTVFHLPIYQGAEFPAMIDHLRDGGARILGTSGTFDASILSDVSLDEPHVWVFGNEARGLSSSEAELCDELVRIPMSGNAESMNVGSAAAIFLYASQQGRFE